MAAKEIIDTIAEAVAEAWGTLFMKTVGLTAGELQAASDVADASGEYVSGSITFEGDVNGESKIFIPKLEALTMVGMMLAMGDEATITSTREGDMGDEELDALNEAFNQLGATTATVIRDKKGCTISASANPCEKAELEGALTGIADDDQSVTFTLDLEGFDSGAMIQTFAADIITSLDGEEGGEDDAMDALASLGLGSDDDVEGGDDLTSSPVESTPETEPTEDPTVQKLKSKGHLKVKADAVLAERSMEVDQLLSLGIGSVIEFWKPCDDPAELILGNSAVANGEIVVSQDQHFCIRVVEIAPPRKTYQKGLI